MKVKISNKEIIGSRYNYMDCSACRLFCVRLTYTHCGTHCPWGSETVSYSSMQITVLMNSQESKCSGVVVASGHRVHDSLLICIGINCYYLSGTRKGRLLCCSRRRVAHRDACLLWFYTRWVLYLWFANSKPHTRLCSNHGTLMKQGQWVNLKIFWWCTNILLTWVGIMATFQTPPSVFLLFLLVAP